MLNSASSCSGNRVRASWTRIRERSCEASSKAGHAWNSSTQSSIERNESAGGRAAPPSPVAVSAARIGEWRRGLQGRSGQGLPRLRSIETRTSDSEISPERNLAGAVLNGANLLGAKLAQVGLQPAAILDGANLKRADLTAAKLTGAQLTSANLHSAILRDAVVDRCRSRPMQISIASEADPHPIFSRSRSDGACSMPPISAARTCRRRSSESALAGHVRLRQGNLSGVGAGAADFTEADLGGADSQRRDAREEHFRESESEGRALCGREASRSAPSLVGSPRFGSPGSEPDRGRPLPCRSPRAPICATRTLAAPSCAAPTSRAIPGKRAPSSRAPRCRTATSTNREA